MSLNTEEHVSMYEAVDRAVSMLKMENYNSMLEDFARWCYEAETKIGSTKTFKRFECELNIEDYKTCVPKNFMYLNELRIGGVIIDVTKRNFQMFNKAPKTSVTTTPSKYLNGHVICAPGQAGTIAVNFLGAFATADLIVITVTVNDCGNIRTHVFQYLVQPGDSTSDIINEFANQINAILYPFNAQVNLSTMQLLINGKDATVSFNITTSTTSVGGSLTQTVIQQRVAPSENCDPCDDTPAIVPASGSGNLANRGAYNLNNQDTGKVNIGDISGFNDFSTSNSVHAFVNGYIYFNTIKDGKVGISYMGIEFDEDGWPMIKASHIEAVSKYLIYMIKLQELYAGEAPDYVVNRAERDWDFSCGQARGDDEMPNAQEMVYLARMWNQFVPLPNKNLF